MTDMQNTTGADARVAFEPLVRLGCKLVVEDWRRIGEPDSIYCTQLGIELSSGDLHSGTTFDAVVHLPDEVVRDIAAAFEEHGAYLVFRLMPNAKVKATHAAHH